MNLWPYLRPVEAGQARPAVVDPFAWPALVKVAAEVYRRTFARMWVQTEHRQIVFGYRRATGYIALIGHEDIRLTRDSGAPNVFDPVADQYGVDDLCYMIQLGQVDPKRKELWAKARRTAIASDKQSQYDRWWGENYREARIDAEKRMSRARMATRTSKRRAALAA